MTNAVIAKLETFIQDLKAEFSPEVKIVENDVKAAGKATLTYIENNALQDAYQIVLAIVQAAVSDSPWGATLSVAEAAVVASGKAIGKGAVAILAAQAQADLISIGTLVPPAAA